MNRLVLFDIDGTLLTTHGAGRTAMKLVFTQVLGTAGPIDDFPMAGKTDTQIAWELMRLAGFKEVEIEVGLKQVWALYPRQLEAIIGDFNVSPYAGVTQLLDRLDRHDDVRLGLLTGNVEEAAWVKLAAAGLDGYFQWGAFGSDHSDRPRLLQIAVERAYTRFGRRFKGKEIVIVGDTPYDINCGKGLRAKAVAVATGVYSWEELQVHSPDHLFPDFRDTAKVLEAIVQ